MAGVSERRAFAGEKIGRAYASHLGVDPKSERGRAIVYGTKRHHPVSRGWKPNREARRGSIRAADDRLKTRRTA